MVTGQKIRVIFCPVFFSKWAASGVISLVLDLARRKIVGWALGNRSIADLACEALRMAIVKEKLGLRGFLIEFINEAKSNG